MAYKWLVFVAFLMVLIGTLLVNGTKVTVTHTIPDEQHVQIQISETCIDGVLYNIIQLPGTSSVGLSPKFIQTPTSGLRIVSCTESTDYPNPQK